MSRRKCCCDPGCLIFQDEFDGVLLNPDDWAIISGTWTVSDNTACSSDTLATIACSHSGAIPLWLCVGVYLTAGVDYNILIGSNTSLRVIVSGTIVTLTLNVAANSNTVTYDISGDVDQFYAIQICAQSLGVLAELLTACNLGLFQRAVYTEGTPDAGTVSLGTGTPSVQCCYGSILNPFSLGKNTIDCYVCTGCGLCVGDDGPNQQIEGIKVVITGTVTGQGVSGTDPTPAGTYILSYFAGCDWVYGDPTDKTGGTYLEMTVATGEFVLGGSVGVIATCAFTTPGDCTAVTDAEMTNALPGDTGTIRFETLPNL